MNVYEGRNNLRSVRLAMPARVVMGTLGISPFMLAVFPVLPDPPSPRLK